MESSFKIEDFFGVYLLCSKSENPKYRGSCYIGYTVNPNRRIKQHNKGTDFGGAKKTNNKGPWLMVMIVHGFPNNISALQFEWAWQWPKKSSRLKSYSLLQKKLRKETNFEYHFRILSYMLKTGPWNRLPLTIRWFANDYHKDFPPDRIPPIHMKIQYGSVLIKKKKKVVSTQMLNSYKSRLIECHMCMKIIENCDRSKVTCINPTCVLTCHITCLANHCLEKGEYIPIEGICPICEISFVWGDLIRKKNGCNDLEYIENFENTCISEGSDDSDVSTISDDYIP